MAERGWCPFFMDQCKVKCVFYRRGIRQYDGVDKKPEPFEECAINIAVDCLENIVSRNISLQKEMNLVRNATEEMGNIFKIAMVRAEQNKISDTELKEIK